MILEYSYDKATKILEMLKSGDIATLNVSKVTDSDGDKFALEYTLVTDYPEMKQDGIRKAMTASLSERLNAIRIYNIFLENMVLGNVDEFLFQFDAISSYKCSMTYSYKMKRKLEEVVVIDQLIECLERFELLATKVGIENTDTKLFLKEGGQKSKKYTSLTLLQVSQEMRKAMEE